MIKAYWSQRTFSMYKCTYNLEWKCSPTRVQWRTSWFHWFLRKVGETKDVSTPATWRDLTSASEPMKMQKYFLLVPCWPEHCSPNGTETQPIVWGIPAAQKAPTTMVWAPLWGLGQWEDTDLYSHPAWRINRSAERDWSWGNANEQKIASIQTTITTIMRILHKNPF